MDFPKCDLLLIMGTSLEVKLENDIEHCTYTVTFLMRPYSCTNDIYLKKFPLLSRSWQPYCGRLVKMAGYSEIHSD